MINLPIKDSKNVQPTFKVVLYGIEVDSVAHTLHIPPDKVSALRAKLIEMSKRKNASLHDVQSLVASLEFAVV